MPSQAKPRHRCLFIIGWVDYQVSHSNSHWIGSGILFVGCHMWVCALSAAHILAYSSHLKESVHSSLTIGLTHPLVWLIVASGTVITLETLWINQTVENTLIFSPIHQILASARWRGEKCSVNINPTRSGVSVWETGYNWGDRVTRNNQMSLIECDMHSTVQLDNKQTFDKVLYKKPYSFNLNTWQV